MLKVSNRINVVIQYFIQSTIQLIDAMGDKREGVRVRVSMGDVE